MAKTHTSDGLGRVVVAALAAVLLVPLLVMAFTMPMMGWWWGGRMMDGVSPLWGLGLSVLWLVAVVGTGYVLYRGLVGQSSPDAGNDPAIEELRMAYARGDVSEEEFEARRAKLGGRD